MISLGFRRLVTAGKRLVSSTSSSTQNLFARGLLSSTNDVNGPCPKSADLTTQNFILDTSIFIDEEDQKSKDALDTMKLQMEKGDYFLSVDEPRSAYHAYLLAKTSSWGVDAPIHYLDPCRRLIQGKMQEAKQKIANMKSQESTVEMPSYSKK